MEADTEESSEFAPPSRSTALALTALFGGGLGFFYVGRTRRAVLWAFTPFALVVVFWLVIARARSQVLYASFLPSVLVFPLARLAALVDVARVSPLEFRRVSMWRVSLFYAAEVACIVLAVRLVQAHALQAFRIPADSMQPTLIRGDHVLVDVAALGGKTPRRAALVAFTDPDQPAYDFIRRVIALPGEGFEVKDNRPWINDWQVPYCVVAKDALVTGDEFDGDTRKGHGEIDLEYLGEQAYLVFLDGEPRENAGPWVVQSDEFFVLNDNRSVLPSGRGDGIPLSNLIGRPLFVWLTIKANGSVDWPRLSLPLDEPRLPSTLASLEPALRHCLASRPAQTEPPVVR